MTLWSDFLGFLGKLIVPDWGALVALLPLFIVGPILLYLMFAAASWTWFTLRRRRPKVRLVEEGPRPAALDSSHQPIFPRGLPYCRRDSLVYPSGSSKCDVCGDELGVECPMCGLARPAAIDTCGNCGLVFRIEPRTGVLRPAGPPPGGDAAA
jgi:hypothetical protein